MIPIPFELGSDEDLLIVQGWIQGKGILSPHDGVIGLDFFRDTVLTIDFQKFEITLQP